MLNFKSYSKYYDLLYKDKNYKEECDYVIKIIKKFLPEAKYIVELGSGSGAHAKFFCKEGYKVTGIEKSREMVVLANSKQIIGLNSIIDDISSYHIEESFDVAISLFHVMSYLITNESLINCFKSTYNHLNKNGIFIFDLWYSPAVYHQKPETRIKRLENNDMNIVRFAESKTVSDKNMVEVNFEVYVIDKKTKITETISEKHLMRHFSIPEIKLLAELTGFEVIQIEEFLTEKTPSEETWGVCFVLKKN